MMTFKVMRELAVFRHRVLWWLQGGQPEAWPAHEFWIAMVYGK